MASPRKIKTIQKFAKIYIFEYNWRGFYYIDFILMLENTRLGKQFRNVVKVLGVAVAVYLALTLKIWITWEVDKEVDDVDKVVQLDYLESETKSEEELIDAEETESHWANSAFYNLCSKYKNICNKISWVWDFTDEYKATKFAYIAYLLKNLDMNVTRGKDPSEALLAMLVNEKKWARRGSANWTTITINLWWMEYDNEFFQVISHEMGHIVDLGWLQWVSSKMHPNFTEFNKEVFAVDDPSLEYYKYSRTSETVRKSWMTKEDFCSWYGMSDPFEDFAECHNLYLNHHDYFREIARNNSTVKNKYNFMSNLYGWKYINDSVARYEDRDNSYRVWDTTKIREG